jgi:hypothetical protein
LVFLLPRAANTRIAAIFSGSKYFHTNADEHTSSNPGGGQGGPDTYRQHNYRQRISGPTPTAEESTNYVRPILEHPKEGQALGMVTLNNTIVAGNRSHNCEQQTGTITGC